MRRSKQNSTDANMSFTLQSALMSGIVGAFLSDVLHAATANQTTQSNDSIICACGHHQCYHMNSESYCNKSFCSCRKFIPKNKTTEVKP